MSDEGRQCFDRDRRAAGERVHGGGVQRWEEPQTQPQSLEE